jgi:hypothetical protein
MAESSRGKYRVARMSREEYSATRNPLVPRQLGLLRERNLGDPVGAEAANLRGIDFGDAFSAYSLASLYRPGSQDCLLSKPSNMCAIGDSLPNKLCVNA